MSRAKNPPAPQLTKGQEVIWMREGIDGKPQAITALVMTDRPSGFVRIRVLQPDGTFLFRETRAAALRPA